MATFISLLNFTDQGIRNVKESPNRAKAFHAKAESFGVHLKEVYWTVGQYDLIAVMDAPDDESVTSALLALGLQGNVRSQSLRAFNSEEIRSLIDKVHQ